jgi:hypothetical protein
VTKATPGNNPAKGIDSECFTAGAAVAAGVSVGVFSGVAAGVSAGASAG